MTNCHVAWPIRRGDWILLAITMPVIAILSQDVHDLAINRLGFPYPYDTAVPVRANIPGSSHLPGKTPVVLAHDFGRGPLHLARRGLHDHSSRSARREAALFTTWRVSDERRYGGIIGKPPSR